MEPITIALALAKATGLTEFIGRKLGGDRGAEVAGKIVDVAESVTGQKDPKAMLDAMRRNQALAHQLKMKMLELSEADARREAEDRANARAKEIAISNSAQAPLLVKVVPAVLSLGVVAMCFVVFLVLMFVDINAENKDVVVYVLGALNSAMTMVLGYHFGSSLGSKSKDAAMAGIVERFK